MKNNSASALWYISLPTLHHYAVELPPLAFPGESKRTTTRFSFFYLS